MKVISKLTSTTVSESKVAHHFRNRSNEEMLRALDNPDHSEAVKSAIWSILINRGMTDKQISHWRIPDEELYVPPFDARPTFEQALYSPIRRRKNDRILSIIGFLLFMTAMALLIKDVSWRQAIIDRAI